MCTPDPRGNVTPFQQNMASKFQAAGMNVPAGTRGFQLLAATAALAARNRNGLGGSSASGSAVQAQKAALGTSSTGNLGG
jgi:hypothetical protein